MQRETKESNSVESLHALLLFFQQTSKIDICNQFTFVTVIATVLRTFSVPRNQDEMLHLFSVTKLFLFQTV